MGEKKHFIFSVLFFPKQLKYKKKRKSFIKLKRFLIALSFLPVYSLRLE